MENAKKTIAEHFNKIHDLIENPDSVDFEDLKVTLNKINLYNLDLIEKSVDDNFEVIDSEFEDYPFDFDIKLYIAESLLNLSQKLPLKLIENEGYFATYSDLENGCKSFSDEEPINESNETIEKINKELFNWLITQHQLNPFFWRESGEFKVKQTLTEVSKEIDLTSDKNWTTDSLILFVKYLEERNILKFDDEALSNSAKASLLGLLVGFQSEKLRQKFSKPINELKVERNFKTLEIILDNPIFQKYFPSLIQIISKDSKL